MPPQVLKVALTPSSSRMRRMRQIAVCGPYSAWVYSSWSITPSAPGRTSSPPWKSKVSPTATLRLLGQQNLPSWWCSLSIYYLSVRQAAKIRCFVGLDKSSRRVGCHQPLGQWAPARDPVADEAGERLGRHFLKLEALTSFIRDGNARWGPL